MKREFLILIIVCPLLIFLLLFREEEKVFQRKQTITTESDFAMLMGLPAKQKHIKRENDKQNLEYFTHVYEKNYSLQLKPGPNFKIPKVIHFIWIGPRPFPQASIEHIRTWIAYHPDWTVKFWTDRDRPCPVKGMKKKSVQNFSFSHLKEYFDRSDNWGEKADILRYEILYKEGGLYVDHDANCLRAFHQLHQTYDFFAGLEMPHDEIGGFAITAGIGVIGTKPEHPVIKGAIDAVANRWQALEEIYASNDPITKSKKVMNRTYLALTLSLMNNLNLNSNQDVVFPASYFYAQNPLLPFYSKHFYGNSWMAIEETTTERFIAGRLRRAREWMRKMMVLEVATLILLIGSFSLFFQIKRSS